MDHAAQHVESCNFLRAQRRHPLACIVVKQAGKEARLGVTATSHKVIRNLLDEVGRAADERDLGLNCIQKVSEEAANQGRLAFTTTNGDVFDALGSGCQVAAGTAWLWARPEARGSVDEQDVDRAAQMCLANVLAISHAGTSLVLLGGDLPGRSFMTVETFRPLRHDQTRPTCVRGGAALADWWHFNTFAIASEVEAGNEVRRSQKALASLQKRPRRSPI